jgi:anti-sigma regulatory factor (Ser/Thr protein kinase)
MFEDAAAPEEDPNEAEVSPLLSSLKELQSLESDIKMVLITPNGVMRIPVASPEMRCVAFELPADNRAARHLRHRVMEFARALPFSSSDLDSIEIAVGEAAQNAARHGSPRSGDDHLQVYCEHTPGEFVVEITDQGGGFHPEAVPSPIAEDLKINGYGLCLMQGLMDEIEFITASHGGTKVRMMKRYAVTNGPAL